MIESEEELIYRYTLERRGLSKGSRGVLLYIMLNPSTADDTLDDRTIESCTRLAIHNGYHSFLVGNLYGVRSTDPKFLKELSLQQAEGCYNFETIRIMLREVDDVVVAWGRDGMQGTSAIRHLLKGLKLLCIGENKNGSPKHPLYQKSDSTFKPWDWRNKS